MKKQASPTLETEQGERPVVRLPPTPPSDSPSTVLALIERVALDPRADVEKLERVMAMYERLKAKEAELASIETQCGALCEIFPGGDAAHHCSVMSLVGVSV